MAKLLRRHRDARVLTVDDPEIAASIFMRMVVSGPVRIVVPGDPMPREEIEHRVDCAIRLFLGGART